MLESVHVLLMPVLAVSTTHAFPCRTRPLLSRAQSCNARAKVSHEPNFASVMREISQDNRRGESLDYAAAPLRQGCCLGLPGPSSVESLKSKLLVRK